jgi:hypothetical protein
MTRFLLALLAMLTGIAFTGQPVSARVCADDASAMRSVDCAVVIEVTGDFAPAAEPTRGAPDRQVARAVPSGEVPAAASRSVRGRCDRALE